MKAVIVCHGPHAALLGMDEHQPGPMLPLGDRPFLQHVVEYLILSGARDCSFILTHLPEKVEEYFGDGSRWGCRFSYHLVATPAHSWRMLRNICSGCDGTVLLAQGQTLPADGDLSLDSRGAVILCNGDAKAPSWSGWAAFPANSASSLFADASTGHLNDHLLRLANTGDVVIRYARQCLDCQSPEGLLHSQFALVNGGVPRLMLNGNKAEPGICIGHGVSIHPTAQLLAPLYIGPNSRVGAHAVAGPGVVISENCIVDSGTTVVNSLIMPGTYIGEALELDGVIVDRNRLVNSRLGTACLISESFLVGSLTGKRSGQASLSGLANRVVALTLYFLTLPVLLVMFLRTRFGSRLTMSQEEFVVLPIGIDDTAASRQRIVFRTDSHDSAGWRHFTHEFVPGLISVFRGQLNLVGVPPRSAAEIAKMPEEWRGVYISCRAGLITEALIVYGARPRFEEAYSADAFFCGMQSASYSLRLLLRYIAHILSNAQPGTAVQVGMDCEAE